MNPQNIAQEIFLESGGVDDFGYMRESEIRVIVHRELLNCMVEYVVEAALVMQEEFKQEEG